MSVVETRRTIAAPLATVFETVAYIENFSKAVPEIVSTEFVTDVTRGAGTRFRETRRMGSREHTVELEVTEFADNDAIRIVADEGGTVWDTVFRVAESGDATVLTMRMEARPYRLFSRLVTPLMVRMVRKNVEADMDAVKRYCEEQRASDDP